MNEGFSFFLRKMLRKIQQQHLATIPRTKAHILSKQNKGGKAFKPLLREQHGEKKDLKSHLNSAPEFIVYEPFGKWRQKAHKSKFS